MGKIKLCLIALGVLLPVGVPAATVVPHPLNVLDERYSDFLVKVDGKPVEIVKWFSNRCYAHFFYSTSDTVTVEVTAKTTLGAVTIAPLRYGLKGTKAGNTLSFRLSGQKYLSIGLGVAGLSHLFLFADSLEAAPPKPAMPMSSTWLITESTIPGKP